MKYGEVGGYGSVPKKKGSIFVKLFCLLLVVLLGVGGYFGYKYFFSKNSVEMLFEAVYDGLETFVSDESDSVTGDFSFNMKFTSTDKDENSLFSVFNKLNFSGNYGIDYDKNVISLDLKSDYDDKDLIDVSLYTEYGRGYVYLDGLYDKYIDSSIDNYSKLFEKKTDDYKSIIKGVRKAMNDALEDEYFITEKVTVDSKRLLKTTLDLTGDNYQDWNRAFTNSLLSNQSYLDSYAKVFDKSVDDVKKELENDLEEEKDYDGEKIVIYTDKYKFVKLEMSNPENRISVKLEDGKYEYELYEKEVEFGSGVVELTFKDDKVNGTISYYDGEEELGFEMEFSSSMKVNGEVERKDISNSISYDKLTDADFSKITDKLGKNEGIVKIIEEFSALFGKDEEENNPSKLQLIILREYLLSIFFFCKVDV